ncbi:hypothetical protein NLG97_g1928 [Lecanicillium saksenae]|uniref:Uncharacterized protein n=1 Tax=Lecanicillium saksenae TaxID=468837 RepID=A0ACC1R4Y9_9HYPO|nr:hypothetical protein NLG97_g1928 [Lecanicillium saksenae]
MAHANAQVDLFPGVPDQDNAYVDDDLRFIPVEISNSSEIFDGHEIETEGILRLACSLVLGIYTGASDVSFGFMRNKPAWNKSPAKIWPHRMEFDKTTPVMDLLKQTSSHNSHQDGEPSDVASRDLAIDGYDTILMLDTGVGRAFEVLKQPNMAKIKLVFAVNGTAMHLGYRVSMIGSLQARSMAAAISRTISTVIHRPSAAMHDLDLCNDEDLNILEKWNDIETLWQEKCVHDVFSEQVAANADSLAVDAWDGRLTYGELDHLSSSLADHLMDLGVKPGEFVALCFDKSKWLVVSILAAIKAGCAYVVIEPYYPPARMTDICIQLQVKTLLAGQDLLHIANTLSSQVVTVEHGADYFFHGQGDNGQRGKHPSCSPQDALYVVFSSGSTGKPKGIIVEHAAFVSWGTTLRQSLGLGGHSRVLQFSSFAFLIAHRDVLLTLMFGGCVCIPSELQRLNHLETFIGEYRVNWANLTPSVAALLDPSKAVGLETLLLTSEPMSLSSLAMWEGKVNLLFAYGQAESVSLCCVRKSPTVGSDRKNVGHRVGRAIWLVDPDDHNKLVPVGAVGELVIQGPILARGYLDSERTALAFVHGATWLRKLQPRYCGRLYKTGDLAQFADDGSVRYISRKDNSVKLYGQRLDLDEVTRHVERCLVEMSDSAVSNVVVDLSHAPHSKDIKLTAFLGLNFSSPDTSRPIVLGPLDRAPVYLQEFRSRLADVVPRYMIPALAVIVSHIPLNLSGKTDRKQLREILSHMTVAEVASCLGSTTNHEAPRTEQELKLRSLWSQVLNTAESGIGRHDDFFRIGGDSLMAMKLVSAAHAEGLSLAFKDVFAHARLSSQAELIDSTERCRQNTCCAAFELIGERRKQTVLAIAAEKYGLLESDIEDIYPATPMQEGLIALNELRPGSYVSRRVYRTGSDVDPRKLEAAWRSTLDANPTLRTHLVRCSEDGSTYQVIVRSQRTFDVSQDLDDYIARDEAKIMNFGVPLIRVAFIYNGNGQLKLCVVTMHHCIYDAWSMALLLEQVCDAYRGSNLTRQTFREFVKYVFQSETGSAEHWKAELAGVRAEQFPALPSQTHSLKTTESETLKIRISQSDDSETYITLATRIQLAWAVTLAKYTGESDVVFGLTVSGRASPVAGIAKMTGPTIATFPLRVQLRSTASMKEELQTLQDRVISTIPFEHFGLHNISRLGDDAAKACKFQSLLVIQQSQSSVPRKSEILGNTQDIVFRPIWDTYALSILCTPSIDGNIHVEAVYDAAVVPKAQMRRILQVFAHILEQTVSSPHTKVADIDSISSQDMQQIQEWNKSVAPTVSKGIHEMIRERALSQPQAKAIDAWDGQFTYKELNERSSLLAVILTEHGLHQEIFVPICLEKSKWVAVAILAVNKAGGAFILLDTSHPADRLASMCKNAQAPIILCSEDTADLAAELGCQHLVQVDRNITSETTASSLANVYQTKKAVTDHSLCAIYTSGSTGAPKGIVIEHSAMATQIVSLVPRFGLNCKSRIFQFASHAFDVAVSDYLFGLAAGACICVPKQADSRDNLASAMRKFGANWTFLTPSVARTLIPCDVPELQVLVIGGESAKAADFRTWSGALRLLYVYGPAECTIFSTVKNITGPSANPVNLGAGVTGASWLVEPSNPEKLVAIGAVGELVIEGPLVAREYLGDMSLSRSSFIPYPKWLQTLRGANSLSRLYRTGDMLRYSSIGDGSLEFVGRKDNQVKLHGQRMELAEIEHHVSQYFPLAIDAIVEIINPVGSTDQKILTAFIWDASAAAEKGPIQGLTAPHESNLFGTPDVTFQSTVVAAETKLRDTLPRFMIPSLYIPLAQLPLSPNGKANRRLIQSQACLLSRQELGIYQSLGTSDKRPPFNESEVKIHRLAANVLGLSVNEIGLNDNFFQLGGDSIKAMIMSTRATEIDLKLATADILAHPRLCDMAEVAIRESTNESRSSALHSPPPAFSLLPKGYNHNDLLQEVSEQCELSQDSVEDVYPCTPLQEGLFALTMKQPTAYVFKFTLQLCDDLDLDRFHEAWSTVISSNPILRTRIICASCIGGNLLQAVVQATSVRQSNGVANQHPIGLGKPLFNIKLEHRGNNGKRYNAEVTMHHALYDGVSLGLILRQLSAAYCHGENTFTPPYKCFIQHCLAQPAEDELRRFWHAELADAAGSVFTAAPLDSYVLRSPTHAEYRTPLTSDTQINAPLSAALKLAWGIVLSSLTGESDAVFGTVVSGRMANMRGIDKVAGPTIATVPFRITCTTTTTIQKALEEVQSRSLKMIRFEQTGLQRIRQLGFADACRFQSLLIVQFAEEEDFPESPLYEIFHNGPEDAFHTYPLTIVCTPSAGSIHLRAAFDSDVISATLVDRLLVQYSLVLQYIISNPWKSVNSIPLQSTDDAAQVWAWNELVPPRENTCVHNIISKNLMKRRDASAVCAWDGNFTYEELEDMSNRLAGLLTSLGVGLGTMVPLCFEKSKWALVATLAVLKAGGTFVPLDMSQAATRRESILARVNAAVILTSAKYATTLSATGRTIFAVYDLSLMDLPLLATSKLIPALNKLAVSAAYVFFTSGSTGQPKGVVVDHCALSTSCIAHGSKMGFDKQTRMLQFTSYTFDISLMEIFTTLIYGGCVCVPSDDDRFSNLELSASIMKVNTVSLTASVARLIQPNRIPSLETIIFVGENATDDDFKKWRHLPQIFDAYGPTECTIFCSINKVEVSSKGGSVIGKAVGAVSWLVSPEDHNRLVPIGAVGELLVEGPVLARGYLDDTEKTLEAFIQDPPWLVDGAAGYPGRRGRVYKTGDLARYNEDGSLTYCGRKDTQVKIRGHRVELGDVECHIRDCMAGVSHAVVMPISPDGQDASPVLTAFLRFDDRDYVQQHDGHSVSISSSLREKLADRLPAYMIPSVYLAVTQLPLNTSGKMDRRQLQNIFINHFREQAIGNIKQLGEKQNGIKEGGKGKLETGVAKMTTSPSALSSTFRDCSNETEKRIRAAWATILGLQSEMISADDNFYDIGGDSIRIISLMRRIRNEFGIHLRQSLLNSRNTTIHKIAEYVDKKSEVSPTFDLEIEIGHALSSVWAGAASRPCLDPAKQVNMPSIVFLTGGTGFLGTQILHCLLKSTAVRRVVALVRATSADQGLERLKQTAVIAGWWEAGYEACIEVWVGDLELSKLGLSDAQLCQLSGTSAADNIDAIIHNGAVVNWHMDYDRLRAPNVLATIELLKVAAFSRSSPRFVFVSGGAMADLDASPGNTAVLEQLRKANGYSQSKFVAESIVRRFASQLAASQNRFSVLKPGIIIGAGDKGVANIDDFIWRIVAAASRLGIFPEDPEDSWVPITDAEFVASQTVGQILSDDSSSYFNIASKFGLCASDFWQQVNSELKNPCAPVPWSVWVERALEDTDTGGQSHPLWPVQEVLRGRTTCGISITSPLSPPNKKVLCDAVKANVRYLGRVGFLHTREGENFEAQPGILHRSATVPVLNL